MYHFVEPLIVRKRTPSQAYVGSRVTLLGKGLAATTGVTFGGAKAHFRIVTDGKVLTTVPQRAKTGPIVVTSALKQVRTKGSFHVLR